MLFALLWRLGCPFRARWRFPECLGCRQAVASKLFFLIRFYVFGLFLTQKDRLVQYIGETEIRLLARDCC